MVEVNTCNERTEDVKEDMRTDGSGHTVENVAREPVSHETKEDLETQTQKTRTWIWSVVYLCFYGFMVQLKPGEPFITPYLLSTENNFTSEQVTNEIIPVLSYSYMSVLVPVFLLTDYLRYKPVLILQSLSHVSIWLLLLLGTSLLEMQFMEFFYGITMAARVAYSSYIFSLVPATVYQRVASYSRSSVLMGVFTSSVLGQICVSLGGISYRTLSAVSLGLVTFGLLLSFCLPWPKRSLFFNQARLDEERKEAAQSELARMKPEEKDGSMAAQGSNHKSSSWTNSVFIQMLKELKNVVKVPSLRLWSLWWVFNSTGYYLVVFYVHILWNEVYPATDKIHVYNGAVESASTLLGAITSFAAGYVKIRWNLWSELVIGLITAAQAGLLLLMGITDNIWVCYVAYALFRGFYQFLVPIAIFQIASSLTKELCALVFGVNTFLGTVLKTIITIIVADKRGLALNVQSQFFVYFFYFTLLTVVYLGCSAFIITCHYRNQRAQEETTEVAIATELSPMTTAASEGTTAHNGTSIKT
ncbi:folate transporter 1-like isoform X1 [Sinocyclocheilus rhinocerous]|uniref:Folate transporter 1-like n=2 Tax=Sinocyclocheilus rhinocerous TaxID=307959 RepID=A0A673GP72_9TELE|nr:PREDICTED: folate transporter 1-like isoform X1 [Sinocyclocheilus rhinocerous]XP_016382176.1 PREDICTED: folate transporter 1-like isoform X1 [Sinocyclocheilus rhinocerous]XP_016382177.1 PREDICTED: folate transporter 1-like isoform X1 [Sinocyclocheilus rhinocerous]